MFNGTHLLLYSSDPAADRAFLRDVLGFSYVDTGDGWLIFRLPPGEAGVHPKAGPNMPEAARASGTDAGGSSSGGADAGGADAHGEDHAGDGGAHGANDAGDGGEAHGAGFMVATVWLMCDDIAQAVSDLARRGVDCPEPVNEGWGIATSFALPSGERLGLYQPIHEKAIEL